MTIIISHFDGSRNDSVVKVAVDGLNPSLVYLTGNNGIDGATGFGTYLTVRAARRAASALLARADEAAAHDPEGVARAAAIAEAERECQTGPELPECCQDEAIHRERAQRPAVR